MKRNEIATVCRIVLLVVAVGFLLWNNAARRELSEQLVQLELENDKLSKKYEQLSSKNQALAKARDNLSEAYNEKNRELNAMNEAYLHQKSLSKELNNQLSKYLTAERMREIVWLITAKDYQTAAEDAAALHPWLYEHNGAGNEHGDAPYYDNFYVSALDALESLGYITVKKDDNGNYISVELTDR